MPRVLGECQSLRHLRRRFSTRAKRAQKFPVGSEKASAIRRGRRASREGVERVGRGRRVALVPGALERGGVLFRAPAVNLHALAPHAKTDAREIVVRFPPVERPLDHLADAVDPVESHGEQTAGEKRDILVRYREYERRGVDEEEGDEVGHLDVLERNRRGDDAFARFQRREDPFALAVQIERAALAHVPEPSMVFHDGLHARHHGVGSVLKRHARVRRHLVRVSK